MVIACWSVKGGSGTSTVAAALALTLARGRSTLLVDLGGDQPALLGLPEPDGPGVLDVVGLGAAAPFDAMSRLEIDVIDRLSLLPCGSVGPVGGSPDRVVAVLRGDVRAVVVDCGTISATTHPLACALAAGADRSLLVTRACYLGLRRAADPLIRPSGVILVKDVGRALGASDVAGVIGAPVVAEIDVDPAVARLVDAGLLATRLPRRLVGALERAA
jgi:hypothetical protein